MKRFDSIKCKEVCLGEGKKLRVFMQNGELWFIAYDFGGMLYPRSSYGARFLYYSDRETFKHSIIVNVAPKNRRMRAIDMKGIESALSHIRNSGHAAWARSKIPNIITEARQLFADVTEDTVTVHDTAIPCSHEDAAKPSAEIIDEADLQNDIIDELQQKLITAEVALRKIVEENRRLRRIKDKMDTLMNTVIHTALEATS